MVTPENIRVGFCAKVVRHLRRRLSKEGSVLVPKCPSLQWRMVEAIGEQGSVSHCHPELTSGSPQAAVLADLSPLCRGGWLTAGKEPRQLREAQHRIPGASAAGVHSCTFLEQSWGRVVPVLGSHGHQQSRFPDWKDAKTSSNTLVHAWHPST